MQIKVEVKSDILGDSVFWEGPADRAQDICNIPARETAKLVAQDGVNRVCGMWHVSAWTDEGERFSPPSPSEKLAEFLKANVSHIRPPSVGRGQADKKDQQ